jgi:DNA-binding response OmpR family regulator
MSNVLVVEDEPAVAELVDDALSDAGMSVTVALSDDVAYDILEREARSFAALVTDINLGEGTTGFDVARRARHLNKQIKVIYITGQAAHVERFGVEDAIMFPKPFDAKELADQVLFALRQGAPGN